MSTDPDILATGPAPRRPGSNVRVSHSSHDGVIAVVVSLDGHVLDLRLAPSATQRPAEQLAKDILGCIHSAQELFTT